MADRTTGEELLLRENQRQDALRPSSLKAEETVSDVEQAKQKAEEVTRQIDEKIASLPIIPNEGRIIVRIIRTGGGKVGKIYLPQRENVSAGENLYIGRVVHPGDSLFKKGQIVLFAEYSMFGFYYDLDTLARGEVTKSEALDIEYHLHVVPTADVMAYDERATI